MPTPPAEDLAEGLVEDLAVDSAQTLLKTYDCTRDPVIAMSGREQIRRALRQVTRLADYLTVGVCAATADQGFTTLESYLQALGYDVSLERHGKQEPVFIKYNTRNHFCYLEDYSVSYRGVMITCHSDREDRYNATYGHFPLDLWHEPAA
jgi:hypothetical protein